MSIAKNVYKDATRIIKNNMFKPSMIAIIGRYVNNRLLGMIVDIIVNAVNNTV